MINRKIMKTAVLITAVMLSVSGCAGGCGKPTEPAMADPAVVTPGPEESLEESIEPTPSPTAAPTAEPTEESSKQQESEEIPSSEENAGSEESTSSEENSSSGESASSEENSSSGESASSEENSSSGESASSEENSSSEESVDNSGNEVGTAKEQENTLGYEIIPIDDTVMYATKACNLRSGPGTDYDKIGGLSYAQEITVNGKVETENGKLWFVLKTEDESIQMVSGGLVSETKPVPQQPVVVQPPAEVQPPVVQPPVVEEDDDDDDWAAWAASQGMEYIEGGLKTPPPGGSTWIIE